MSVHWRNSLGEVVDVREIDKEYALNILSMYLKRGGNDRELVDALRTTILSGREPDAEDRARAVLYNKRNRKAGLRFRAPVEDERDAYPAPPRVETRETYEAWDGPEIDEDDGEGETYEAYENRADKDDLYEHDADEGHFHLGYYRAVVDRIFFPGRF